jgi:hypothetical protein
MVMAWCVHTGSWSLGSLLHRVMSGVLAPASQEPTRWIWCCIFGWSLIFQAPCASSHVIRHIGHHWTEGVAKRNSVARYTPDVPLPCICESLHSHPAQKGCTLSLKRLLQQSREGPMLGRARSQIDKRRNPASNNQYQTGRAGGRRQGAARRADECAHKARARPLAPRSSARLHRGRAGTAGGPETSTAHQGCGQQQGEGLQHQNARRIWERRTRPKAGTCGPAHKSRFTRCLPLGEHAGAP